MTRAQERRAVRQAAVTRRALEGFERAIAEWSPTPPAGIEPWAHQAYLEGMRSVRDDLRAELGRPPVVAAATVMERP